ncbi:hypothetical protein D3C81_450780 [compost metagenome]
MFKHSPGAQPEWVVGIRGFGWRLVGQGEDDCFLVRIAIELHAGACLDIRVKALAVTPAGLLAIDHRPTQSAFLVVLIKRGQVMAMAAAKLGVFFEQAFLQVKAKGVGFIVFVASFQLLERELIDLAVFEQHLVQGLALVLGGLGQQLGGPGFIGGKALGKLHQLPQVGLGIPRRADQLVPELGATLGIAKGAFLFYPHGAGQDQVGGLRRDSGVHIRDDHEVLRLAPPRQYLLHDVRTCMHVVAALSPVHVEYAVFEHTALLHRVKTDLFLDGTCRQLPDFFCRGAMLGIGHYQVSG